MCINDDMDQTHLCMSCLMYVYVYAWQQQDPLSPFTRLFTSYINIYSADYMSALYKLE